MISKELLSEVLPDKEIDYVEVRGNKIWFHQTDSKTMVHVWDDMCINIYELAHRCKEWALSNGYFILSAVDGYLIVEDTKDNYKQVYRSSTSEKIPEYIAIFKACEWILEQKGNINEI